MSSLDYTAGLRGYGASGGRGRPRGRGHGRGHGSFPWRNSVECYTQDSQGNWVHLSTIRKNQQGLAPMVRIPVTEYTTATPWPSFFTLTAPPKPPPASVSNPHTSTPTSSYNIDSDQMAEMQEISDLLLQDMVHLNATCCKRGLEVSSVHFSSTPPVS